MPFNPVVLSTRKLKASMLENPDLANVKLLSEDYIGIEHLAFDLEAVNDYVLFTSQNAVKSVMEQGYRDRLNVKPALCVGIKTKELLEANGWIVKAWAHYARDLAPIIIQQFKDKNLTFFSGNIRRDLLPESFRANGVVFNEFTVYQTVLRPIKNVNKVDGLCFYSPSAIASYLQQNNITTEVCFCIGETTAESLKGVAQNIVIAKQPTVEATIQACVDYYK
ncbi:uroporphyrinogen-III synthase [Myroides pelagicus]|uniref:Uroporphyrinogen-III synthase n=1 Tax=Myroides pelagicus TaxID=270914 RepID=A0A7K1GPY4_9FLAO|nr:uroporphyrinogen-III synthase [Myroides pelagicus]MEC4112688.1 uroporphyrinogen-III synthase [Myroides pelagicus]MTH30911.1 uroporphyrinogen-III synthase [Myroides pelagicus]